MTIRDEIGNFLMSSTILYDISERDRTENTLRFVAQRGWMGAAENFLTALAQHVGETLGVDYVIIGRLADEPDVVETAALFARGKIAPVMRYSLKGTPCDSVIGKNLCCYPQGVQALFPADAMLVDMGAESYAGIPLWDSTGQAIGLIAVLDSKPFGDEASIGRMLQLVATPASAALERARSDRILRAREREFRSLAENSPDNISRYTLDGRVTYINPKLEKALGVPLEKLKDKTLSESFADGLFNEVTAQVLTVARTGVESELEVFIPTADNNLHCHNIRFAAERDETGAIVSVLGIGRDITEHKAVRQQQELLERAVNASTDAIFLIDESLRFRYVNTAACSSLGYSREELLTMGPPDIDPDVTRETAMEMLKTTFAGGAVAFESRHRAKDGRVFPVELSASNIKYDGGMISLTVVRDITERKRLESDLFDSRNFLNRIIDTIADPIFVKDRRHRWIRVNEALCRLIGHSREELIGKSDFDYFPEHEARVFWEGDEVVFTSGKEFSNEEVITGARGEKRYIFTRKTTFTDAQGNVTLVGVISDITGRKRAEENLRLAASVFTNAQEGIFVTDADNLILDVNDAFTRITGYDRKDVIGKNPSMLKSGRHDRAFYDALWATLRQTGRWSGEIWNRRKDGNEYAELLTLSAVRDERGKVSQYVGVFADITQLKEHEQQLERIAHYDALTGIPNRFLLADRLGRAIARTHRNEWRLAVCYLDLDGFKPINDHYGHEAGDRLLIEIARRLQGVLRPGDTIARLGGDEFVLLLTELPSSEECRVVLDRVLATVNKPVLIDDAMTAVTVSASIGVTMVPPDEHDADILLRHADQAMYRAKEAGKNRYHLFDPKKNQ